MQRKEKIVSWEPQATKGEIWTYGVERAGVDDRVVGVPRFAHHDVPPSRVESKDGVTHSRIEHLVAEGTVVRRPERSAPNEEVDLGAMLEGRGEAFGEEVAELEENFRGRLTGADDGQSNRSVERKGGERGRDDGGEDRVDSLEVGRGMDDAVRCDDLLARELLRDPRRSSSREDNVARKSLDRRSRANVLGGDLEELNVVLAENGLDCDDLLAERHLATLGFELELDLACGPSEVVGVLAASGSEGRQGDEGDEAGGGDRIEVADERVGTLRVPERRKILQEAALGLARSTERGQRRRRTRSASSTHRASCRGAT